MVHNITLHVVEVDGLAEGEFVEKGRQLTDNAHDTIDEDEVALLENRENQISIRLLHGTWAHGVDGLTEGDFLISLQIMHLVQSTKAK